MADGRTGEWLSFRSHKTNCIGETNNDQTKSVFIAHTDDDEEEEEQQQQQSVG